MPDAARRAGALALGALLACLAAPLPARALEPLRLGRLELAPCEVGARSGAAVPTQAAYCTRLEVPEDWSDPAGRRIGLRVAVVRSESPEPDRDLVVFLDGGPGGAATEDYPAVAAALAPLRRRHDIVLVDQRGTGGSNPLACGSEFTLDIDKPSRRPAPISAGAPDAGARQLDAIRRCLAALEPRAAPQFYATGDAVRDLAAVYQALGARPFDLVGVSYGTRVAQRFAMRYPKSVRSLVLDGAVPNRVVLPAEFAANLEDALRRRLALCTANAACAARYGDPYATLRRVLADLRRRRPPAAEMRDPRSFEPERQALSADELAALVRFYMYNAATASLLPYVIDEASAGRYAPLLGQAQFVVSDLVEQINGGMSASVLCTDDADLLRERPQDDDTVLGGGMVRAARLACRVWPHRRRADDFHAPFVSALPALLLAGEFDPVTPPRYGGEIAADLPNSRLLVAAGEGHAVLGAGCMPKLVGRFVEQLAPARLDARCLQALGEGSAFIDANGPAP